MAPLSPKRGSQVQTGRARTRIKTPDNSLAAEKDLWGDRESQTAKGDFSNLGDSGIQASRIFSLKSTQIPTSTRLHLRSQKRVHEPLREADADLRRDGFSVPGGPLSLITLTCGPGALIQPAGTSSYHLHGRTATPQDGSAGHLAAHIARGRHHLHGLDHLHCNSSADIRSISAAGNCRFRLH